LAAMPPKMDKKNLAGFIDFANHHADATPGQIKELCQKVKDHRFHSAFVNPCYISLAKEILDKGLVGTVIAFPLGQETRDAKVFNSIEAARKGADELDISINIGLFKAGKTILVLEEMKAVVAAVKNIRKNLVIKFIIETGFLTGPEIKAASQLVVQAGADFIKTSSGLGPRGASLKDVELIRKAIGDQAKIKVAGGVDTFQEAADFLKAGADRIGTSHAMEIINE
jgi:deoxyribose-phosphate aldolase